MKIHDVEGLVGITKKNIRFYEEQGLLKPDRNGENGYRVYSENDVQILQRIKLMRKLGVSLEEIRKMQNGTYTVGDGMRRHLVTLEREQESLQRAMDLCRQLQSRKELLDQLPAEQILGQMADMEAEGIRFSDRQDRDILRRITAPVLAAVCMVLLMTAVVGVMIWAYAADPSNAPPLPLLMILIAVPLCICGGVFYALAQRVQEIRKGEMDDAKQY